MTFFLTDTYFYMKKALIISDSIPGHFNQSIGIYSLLNEEMDFELSIVEMKWKVRVFRSVFKIIGRKLCKNLSIKKGFVYLRFNVCHEHISNLSFCVLQHIIQQAQQFIIVFTVLEYV